MNIRFNMNCPMDWEAMRGSDERRFCGACGKHVTHLSNMTPDAARAFLERTVGQKVCVRADVDARGAVRFAGAALAAGTLFAVAPALADGSIPNLVAAAAATATADSDTDTPPDGNGPDCDKPGEEPVDTGYPLMGDIDINYVPPPPVTTTPAAAATTVEPAE